VARVTHHREPDRADALGAALEILECPLCREPFHRADGGVTCETGHHFDEARQGYVSLRGGTSAATGDTAAMTEARARVQDSGVHDAIADAIVEAVPTSARWLVDLGGGTGWHASRVLQQRPGLGGVVLDASAPALRRAARAHERLAAVASDVWKGIPIADASVDVVLRIFAPGGGERGAAELERILAPQARVVIVVPDADHHHELVEPLGLLRVPGGKAEEAAASIRAARHVQTVRVHRRHELSRSAVLDLVMMGPNAFHQEPEALAEALAAWPEPVAVTVSVSIVVLEVD
jgi:23S rRNA (guanine745-N1)-methyltransferase